MKILVNASTLVVGGGIQVALNFIKHTLKNNTHKYFYLVSSQVYSQIKDEIANTSFYVAEISPVKLISGKKIRKKILSIESDFKPDVVYSIGAPSYVSFKSIEVIRLTNPWIIGAGKIAYNPYSFTSKLKKKIRTFIQSKYINKNHYIITQTNAAKRGISNRFKIPKSNIFVIPNVQSSIFNQKYNDLKMKDDLTNIFVFAAPYPHKNINIVPFVVKELLDRKVSSFKFKVTIPDGVNNPNAKQFYENCELLKVGGYIDNLGKINFSEAPKIYQQSDILFLPTLLEVFSVTYLEAMASSVPIVTTDLSFSREVCGDAALYFSPLEVQSAVDCLMKIMDGTVNKNELISLGKQRLDTYLEADKIYLEHLNVLEQIFKLKNHG